MVKSAATSIPVTVYNLAQGRFEGSPTPQESPKWKKILPPPSCNMLNKGNNLKPYPLSQPSMSERIPHGLTLCQSPQTCSRPGQIGQFPLTKHPQVKMEKADIPPRVAAIPHAMVLNKPKNNKPAEENFTWDNTPPFAKRKKVQRTVTVTDRKSSRGTITPKTFNTPKPMTFLIGFLSRLDWRKEWNAKMEWLNEKIT